MSVKKGINKQPFINLYSSHVPEEYRVKYIKKDEVIRRLKIGEIILFSRAMFPSSRMGIRNIAFENGCQKVHWKTFDNLKKAGLIELKEQRGDGEYGLQYWGDKNIKRKK